MADEFKDPSEFSKYEQHYSESKLWDKIRQVAVKAGAQVIYLVLCLYYTLMSPDVSVGNKTIIIGALGYFILPIDIIPDFIPGLGFTDDLAALKLAFDAVRASVTPDIENQARQKMAEWFG